MGPIELFVGEETLAEELSVDDRSTVVGVLRCLTRDFLLAVKLLVVI